MKNISILIVLLISLGSLKLPAQQQRDTIRLTLQEAILLAQLQSVHAAVALNELKTSYWEYRTHLADQLPEVNFSASLPAYYKTYSKYLEAGGYTFVKNNTLGMEGTFSIDQNIPLTGGTISLNTSLDFSRRLGKGALNEYVSVPVGVTLTQPVFGVNNQRWKRRIEPVRYKEAKAYYTEQVENITLTTINYFFYLLRSRENLNIAHQNLLNAEKLYEIAQAKREIGHISESELMQLNLSALQAKGKVTEAQSGFNSYMFQIRSFLGLEEGDIINPVVPESVPDMRLIYNDVLEKAQENNYLAQNILRRQLEAEYEVAQAKGERRKIELYASVGYTGKDRLLLDSYRNLMSNQIVEVGFSIPLVDWGKRKGKVKVAESNRDVVFSRLRQEQMNFNQNIFLLVENFNNQASQLEIARVADQIAENRYNTSIQTFMIGKISILDLNDAQNSKDDARLKHIQELMDYWYYFYNVRSLTLYDYLNNRTIDADIEELVRR